MRFTFGRFHLKTIIDSLCSEEMITDLSKIELGNNHEIKLGQGLIKKAVQIVMTCADLDWQLACGIRHRPLTLDGHLRSRIGRLCLAMGVATAT